MPIRKGELEVIEIRYVSKSAQVLQEIKGNTFDHVFVDKRLLGPCWITIKNNSLVKFEHKSTCAHEIIVDSPKDIECTVENLNSPSPPL